MLGRTGELVHTQAQVVSLLTNATYDVPSGQPRSLPVGTYVVIVDIRDPQDGTSTIGAKRVTVSGSRSVIFRARFGKRVRAWLRPAAPTHYSENFRVDTCVKGTGVLAGYATRGRLFVLPASIREVSFAVGAQWVPFDEDSPDPRYVAAAVHHGGIPNGFARVFRQSAMVPVRVVARRGPQSGLARIELGSDVNGTCLGSVRGLSANVTLPRSFTAHVPPGLWSASEQAQDFQASPARRYRLGHSYRLTLNRAVWGPTGPLPYSYYGHVLTLNTINWFTDPTLSIYGGYANVTYRLTHAGQTVLRAHELGSQQRRIAAHLPETGWYTLTEYARRPADRLFPKALSPRADVRLHFYDDFARRQEVRGYLTQFLPAGLGPRDAAAPGSHTTVFLRLRRDKPNSDYRQPTDAVSAVSVWWSGNQGQTWHRLPVTHRHGHRVMIVPNPASGAVSLRATVIDSHGNSSRTTVIDGYAIS